MQARPLPVIALAALVLSGCGFMVETAANSAGIPTPAKAVADKVPPETLIAYDGTTCRVPKARFEHIQIGQNVTCIWTGLGTRFGTRGEPRH